MMTILHKNHDNLSLQKPYTQKNAYIHFVLEHQMSRNHVQYMTSIESAGIDIYGMYFY